MTRHPSHRARIWCTRALLAATFALLPDAAAAQAEEPAGLAAARAALEKYHNPVTAIHDGFLSTMVCMEYPQGGQVGDHHYAPGGMGVHFLNFGNIGAPLDPARPQVLIYEPGGDSLRLVAAEWFVPTQVSAEQPTLFDRPFDGPMEGHTPLMPAELHHWDLHVWLWKPNPAGVFSPTNPNITCPDGRYTFREDKPTMVHKH